MLNRILYLEKLVENQRNLIVFLERDIENLKKNKTLSNDIIELQKELIEKYENRLGIKPLINKTN